MNVASGSSGQAACLAPGTAPRLSASGWKALTAPKAIAVVGASGRESGLSFTTGFLRATRNVGYAGKIYLINNRRSELFGQKCWPSLADLPAPVDVVAVNLPDEKVLEVVAAAIAQRVPALMIHAGGFAERGAAGVARQLELQRLCGASGTAALGPNCLGIASFANRAAVCSMRFPEGMPVGPIGAISQSGAVAGMLLQLGAAHGMSFLASTGNEAVTTTEDLIWHAIDDPATRLIVCFIEALRRPREILPLAERARAAGKPIVMLKVGMTEPGGRVSRGHTGAFAGSGPVYRQAFRQAGITLCEDFDELTQTVALLLAARPAGRRARAGILGTSGGELAAIADMATGIDAPLPEFCASTIAALQRVLHLPADVAPRNPVDVGTGFRNPGSYHDRMRASLRAVASDPAVDMVGLLHGLYVDNADLSLSFNREMVRATLAEAPLLGKPVVIMSSRSGRTDAAIVEGAAEAGVPVLEGAREAMRALLHLDRLCRDADRPPAAPRPVRAIDTDRLAPWQGGVVPQARVFALLHAHGITATPVRFAAAADEAARAASDIGGKLVLKLDTPRVIHKSDVGGVLLGVAPEQAAERFAELVGLLDPPLGAVAGEGVILSPQLAAGTEFYIGAKRDESFGPVVVCGVGGRLLELFARTALLIAPFDTETALDAIEHSGAGRLLRGFRGGPVADLDSLARMMVAVGDLALGLGERLDALDLNPVIVNASHRGGCVVDARLLLRPESEHG